MSTKAISFLGYAAPDKPYRETTYVWAGQAWTTPFMAEATVRLLCPDELLVIVTDEAKRQNLDDLTKRIDNLLPVHPILIPSGHNEDELWIMFDTIAAAISPNDRIIFDITNGFRSLPVLAFLAASYVRVVRGATVERMVYGAYDAAVEGNTPVFDLTPFLALLDWTLAADRFIHEGSASDLAALLRQGMPPGPAMRDDIGARRLGQTLKQAANAMEQVSRALRMTRPLEAMMASAALADAFAAGQPQLISSARPFGLLAERVSASYAPFALSEPSDPAQISANLRVQLELIDWYCSKNQIVQAITLAREWIISLICRQIGGTMLDRDSTRVPIEDGLNRLARAGSMATAQNPIETMILGLSRWEEMLKTWNRLTNLRNDVAHAGMRANPRLAQQLIDDFSRLLPDLHRIVAQFDWFSVV